MLAFETLDILVNPSYAFTRIERFKHSTLLLTILYMFLPQPVAVDIADARSRMNQSS